MTWHARRAPLHVLSDGCALVGDAFVLCRAFAVDVGWARALPDPTGSRPTLQALPLRPEQHRGSIGASLGQFGRRKLACHMPSSTLLHTFLYASLLALCAQLSSSRWGLGVEQSVGCSAGDVHQCPCVLRPHPAFAAALAAVLICGSVPSTRPLLPLVNGHGGPVYSPQINIVCLWPTHECMGCVWCA